jgi:hypothetical protein
MITNRSLPTNIMIGNVVYESVEKAIAWVTKTLALSSTTTMASREDPSWRADASR